MAGAAHLIVDVAGTPCALPQAEIREILPLPRLHQELLACIRDFNVNGERFADDVTMLSLRVK